MSDKLNELKSRINEQIKGIRMVGAPTVKELVGLAERTENKLAEIQKISEQLDESIMKYYADPSIDNKLLVDGMRDLLHALLNEGCEKK